MAVPVNLSTFIKIRKPTVSLILPTLNEAKNLPLVIPYIPLDIVDEVLLVDGYSTDNTIEIAQQLLPSIKVIREPKRGKGAALWRGYNEASGDILIVMDSDGSHDPREIPRFMEPLLEGADFVKGTRFAPKGGTTDMPRLRKMGNWGFVVLVNLLFSQTFTDLAYGYHAFWRHCLDYVDLSNVNGFEVDTAVYLQAIRKKLKVVEVPSFEGFRFYGVGKLNTFPDGWRVLRTIFKEWFASLRHPELVAHVGFRSYGQSPLLSDDLSMAGAHLIRTQSTIENPFSQSDSHSRLGLEELLQVLSEERLSGERDQLIQRALPSIVEQLGASSGSLLLTGPNREVEDGYLVFGRRVEPAQLGRLKETVGSGVVRAAVRNLQPILISNTSQDPRWHKRPWEVREHASRSVLVFPLVWEKRVLGVLMLARPEDRGFTEEDLASLKSVSVSIP